MRGGWRRIGVLIGLVAVVAVPAAAAQVSGAQRAGSTTLPKAMVGTWTRYVSTKALKRYGVTDPRPGTWKITIKRTGLIDVYRPKATEPTLEGTVRVKGTTANLNVGCSTSNKYGWKVSSTGRLLTFTYKSDANCKERAGVMSGAWTKRS